MQKLDKQCLLVDTEQRVMMIFGTYSSRWSMNVNTRMMTSMNIILHQFEPESRAFKVVKNRWGYLNEQNPMLSSVFEQYTVLDNNWHGIIEISESDYVRMALALG